MQCLKIQWHAVTTVEVGGGDVAGCSTILANRNQKSRKMILQGKIKLREDNRRNVPIVIRPAQGTVTLKVDIQRKHEGKGQSNRVSIPFY